MSGGLTKATLWEVESRDDDVVRVEGSDVDVQFNPDSLRLTLRNQVEGGESRGRQVRQHVGKSSTELSFDLLFDTADEVRDDGEARDVRERTAMVERFLVPPVENGERKESPPMVEFHWGSLILDGVMTNLSIDFELFSPDGIPLRARMSVSIQEQDPRYQYLEAGAGSNEASSAKSKGGDGGGDGAGDASDSGRAGDPGSDSRGDPDRTDTAQEGESLSDFAARQGLDPSRWRALADEVDDPLSLPAGQEIPFDSSLGESLGVDSRRGATGGAEASTPARLGLEPGQGGSLARGKALSGAGGLSSALDEAERVGEAAETGAERAAFGAEAGGGAGHRGSEARLSVSGGAEGTDRRSLTFGRGVPLRPRRGGGEESSRPLLRRGGGSRDEGRSRRPADPGRPSWEEDR